MDVSQSRRLLLLRTCLHQRLLDLAVVFVIFVLLVFVLGGGWDIDIFTIAILPTIVVSPFAIATVTTATTAATAAAVTVHGRQVVVKNGCPPASSSFVVGESVCLAWLVDTSE